MASAFCIGLLTVHFNHRGELLLQQLGEAVFLALDGGRNVEFQRDLLHIVGRPALPEMRMPLLYSAESFKP
jgi:hypothetical protein